MNNLGFNNTQDVNYYKVSNFSSKFIIEFTLNPMKYIVF